MRFLKVFFFIIITASCSESYNKYKNIERDFLEPEIINDALFTKFPGNLIVNDKYAVLENPFSNEFFMQIYDINTGEMLGNAGEIGRGPSEFTTAKIEFINQDSVFVFDLNRENHAGLISIKSVIKDNYGFKPLPNLINQDISNICLLKKDKHIYFNPNFNTPFTLVENGIEKGSFGNTPIKKDIINGYNVFQGNVAYNPENKLLIYTTSAFQYMAIYKNTDSSFELKNETTNIELGKIVKDELIVDKKQKGISALALTKDYIVCLQRDYTSDDIDETTVGRDFTKIPKTVFLYNYNGELKKIIDLKYPVIRIAANYYNNNLYAIILNDEFQLVEYSL